MCGIAKNSGATMPAAVTQATVADPTASRSSAATIHHPSSSGASVQPLHGPLRYRRLSARRH